MKGIPTIPESAPFSAEQRQWLNGYLAGLFSRSDTPAGPTTEKSSLGSLLFLYGSQTGGAEMLAQQFARDAKKQGFETRAVGLDAFAVPDLENESRVCIVTSTYGDGEMPDNAQGFWDGLQNGSSPRLDNLEYSVLALGDSSYVQFCEAGKLFDKRLEELGAKRLHPRTDCDVDFEDAAAEWFGGLLGTLGTSAVPSEAAQELAPAYSKKNPFPAVLKTNRVLNGEGSSKETRHLEIVLEGSGLIYEVGDALGVMPANCPEFVEEILQAAGLDGEEAVKLPDGSEAAVRHALTHHCDLSKHLHELPSRGVAASTLVDSLRKLQPRLYSISSSPKAHPGEVHLTVGVVRYELEGRKRKGVCSTFLADRVTDDVAVPVFVQASHGFRLPADPRLPVIMVGPGTGIAPFRAFLEEREMNPDSGKSWLFFGDQHEASDFLYREEMEVMLEKGVLTRLDTAFSRDQAEKIYVQNRMTEFAEELWVWLEEGACFYVCGDAKRMAKDVDAALHAVVESGGGLSPEAAIEYVKNMKSEKRYLRDVY